MHPNRSFRVTDRARLFEFVRSRSFGQIIAVTPQGLHGASVPFLLDEAGETASLRFHLSRGNDLAALFKAGADAFVSLQGPDAYISPDWYGIPDQVPTWNYVAVHIRGRVEGLPQDDLPQLLDDLSAQHEAGLAPKTPWTRAKMTPDRDAAMRNAILPYVMRIDSIEGTWKLSQNKAEGAIQSAINRLEQIHDPMSQAVATLMRADLESQ